MFDWDDLRHFLAVARAGTTLGAARTLGTSQPTVVRRIAALEAAVGTTLFDRRRTGYALTEVGRQILPLAERVETEVGQVSGALGAHRRRLAGRIRVTSAESVANVLLVPAVAAFRLENPDVEIELLIEDRYLDLARGEADLAVRATTVGLENSDLKARLLSPSPWAVYCSRDYGVRAGIPDSAEALAGHSIIRGEGPIGDFPVLRWLEEVAPEARVAWRSNSLTNLRVAVRAGLGVSTLPCLLGGSDPDLVKCFGAGGTADAEIWLVIRPEISRLPYVRAFASALASHFRSNRALIYHEPGGAA